MEKKCLVICASEHEYAFHLSSLLSKRIEYQVHVCSSIQEVKRTAMERTIGILLVEEKDSGEADTLAETVIVFTEEEKEGLNKIFKYQPFEGILSELLNVCVENEQKGILKRQTCKSCKLIGVYSPIHRSGKTTFAIALGKEAAKRESVLYVNFEAYSGWEERVGRKEPYTLADLLYYAKQEKGNLETRIGIMTGYFDELAYIAPMEISEDLKAVTPKEWMELLETLQNRRIYKSIILDFDECVQGLWEMLSECGVIYMPVRDGKVSRAKLLQFERNAKVLGYEDLLEKIVKIRLGRDISETVRQIFKREEWK